MANYNYYLYDSKAIKATPIYLYIRYSKNTVRYYTRESIHPDFWDTETQRAKLTRKFKEFPEFNTRLDNIMDAAKNLFRKYQNDHGNQEPSPAEYKKLLEGIKGTTSGIPNRLIEFWEYFIEKTKQGIRQSTRNSIALSYGQTFTCIKDYAKDKNRRVDFDTMNDSFYIDFVKYMETPKKTINKKGKQITKYGFSQNNIGKHIRNLKRMLNESTELGINKFTGYRRFKVTWEDVDNIYLNEDELAELYSVDLTNNLKLDRVRDLFLVGCWTGLRFSDFTNIHAKDIQGDFIHIKTQKTGVKVVIPIHWTIKAIMLKYSDRSNSLPPDISNVNMNLYLKELGKKLDCFAVKTDTGITKAGMKILTQKEKYKLITTHTARRSFATNMFKAGVPTITIMRVTGHKTERAFLKYIKVTPDEHAKIMMGYFQKLRVV